jgi:hypothetical protein
LDQSPSTSIFSKTIIVKKSKKDENSVFTFLFETKKRLHAVFLA